MRIALLAALGCLVVAGAQAETFDEQIKRASVEFSAAARSARWAWGASRAHLAPKRIGSVSLAAIQDKLHHLLKLRLGAEDRWLGIAGSASLKYYLVYMTLSSPGGEVLSPRIDKREVLDNGIEISVDPATNYTLRADIDIWNIIDGSEIVLRPARGTIGPAQNIPMRRIRDALEAASYVLRVDGNEYWLFFATRPASLGGERDLVFFHEGGLLRTRVWSLPKSQLVPGRFVEFHMGRTQLVLALDNEGELTIFRR